MIDWFKGKVSEMKSVHSDNIQRWRGYPVVGPVVKTAEGAAEAVKGAASFTAWLNTHWRLAIIGVVALVVLLKD